MDPRHRAALRWAGAAALWIAALLAVSPVVGFLLAPVADAAIRQSPGWLATRAIETLGTAAKPLLSAGVALGLVGAAGAVGYLRERHGAAWGGRGWGFWAPALFAVALYVRAPVPVRPTGIAAALATGVPPYLFCLVGGGPARRGTDFARRGALRRVVAGGTALGALGAAARVTKRSGGGIVAPRAGDPLPEREKRTTGRTVGAPRGADGVTETEGAFGFDFGGMPARVGSIEDHYVVDINTQDPVVNTEGWRLDVTGAVEGPYALSLDDLLGHDEAASVPVTTACISNPVGGDLISTTTWEAVPLDAILDRAGVRDAGVDVVTKAVDGYSEAIPVEVAREMDAFVAVGADGETLPVSHGFPARLLLPGRYGMKSTKWLTEISVATGEHDAFWEARGWDEEAVVNTLSYARAAARRGDEVAVGGVAYAGVRGIRSVEVSRDGGETWREAELEAPPSEYAWRRWRRVFDVPEADDLSVVVRAVDGTGTLQTAERTSPHPGGSTGWHRRTFEL